MSEKVNIVGKVDASSVIAILALLAFLLAGFNAMLSPIKKDISRIEKKLDKLIDSKVVSSSK